MGAESSAAGWVMVASFRFVMLPGEDEQTVRGGGWEGGGPEGKKAWDGGGGGREAGAAEAEVAGIGDREAVGGEEDVGGGEVGREVGHQMMRNQAIQPRRRTITWAAATVA